MPLSSTPVRPDAAADSPLRALDADDSRYGAMSFERLLDERVTLKIRINLLENDDSTSTEPMTSSRQQLLELERLITARRRA